MPGLRPDSIEPVSAVTACRRAGAPLPAAACAARLPALRLGLRLRRRRVRLSGRRSRRQRCRSRQRSYRGQLLALRAPLHSRPCPNLPVSFSSEGIPADRARTGAARRARVHCRDALAQPDGTRRDAVSAVVARWPRFLDGWARLGELARDDVEAYACFRVGYHRGLDRLRQSGWRGSGYVRWEHETNRGFLRSLDGLRRAAAAHRRGRRGAALRRVPPPARARLGSESRGMRPTSFTA